MAGKRRIAGKPLLRTVRAERRQAAFAEKLGQAVTPAQRITAAVNYLRAALPAGQASDQQVRELLGKIADAADQIRAERHRAELTAQLAEVSTGRDQISVAARQLRAALGTEQPSPAVAQLAERLVHDLATAADRIHAHGGR